MVNHFPTVLAAEFPWDNQLVWTGAAGDGDWCNPVNWGQEGSFPPIPPPGSPGGNNYCCVLPSQPGPRIGMGSCVNAAAAMLSLNPWAPTTWGAQDTVVTVLETALDVNFGAALQINAQSNYDSRLGGETLVSRAIVNVYGGTVRTPSPANSTNLCGIAVGGGSSTYGDSYGILNMYGGLVSVPRIAIYYGDVNLYGGTLECTTDPNFVFCQDRPENRINVNGGTLKLKGNHVAELNGYITNGRIVCIRGGVLGVPVYDGTWTTLTGTNNFNVAWGPQPANNAVNVRYQDTNSITLSWQPGDLAKQHDVYFGISAASVGSATTASAEYKGTRYDVNNDPYTWTIPGPFTIGGNYYWRIDETNDSDVIAEGLVWEFTTHDGGAYNPVPVNGAAALSEPLQLSWTPGDWAASTNGHRVYFTTVANGGILANPIFPRPTDSRYRGQQTGTTYSLANMAGAFTLVPGTTYYWCVDEVNGSTTWYGPVWKFTPNQYANIDDFEDYNSTNDVNVNWPDGYVITDDGSPVRTGNARRGLVRDATGKYLRYTYNNSGTAPGGMAFSEARRPYSGGTSFTGGGVLSPAPEALRIDYLGAATNAADEVYDRMYVAIEDTTGNVSVYYNPDPNAAQVTIWTSWYSRLTDINAAGAPLPVNMEAITGFAIGFGIRGNNWDFGGDGNVMFDNIRLYAATCVPEFGPTADFDGDCDVDFNDLMIMAQEWLTYNPPDSILLQLSDLNNDRFIDFKDFAILGQEWRTIVLWP